MLTRHSMRVWHQDINSECKLTSFRVLLESEIVVGAVRRPQNRNWYGVQNRERQHMAYRDLGLLEKPHSCGKAAPNHQAANGYIGGICSSGAEIWRMSSAMTAPSLLCTKLVPPLLRKTALSLVKFSAASTNHSACSSLIEKNEFGSWSCSVMFHLNLTWTSPEPQQVGLASARKEKKTSCMYYNANSNHTQQTTTRKQTRQSKVYIQLLVQCHNMMCPKHWRLIINNIKRPRPWSTTQAKQKGFLQCTWIWFNRDSSSSFFLVQEWLQHRNEWKKLSTMRINITHSIDTCCSSSP